VVELITEDNLDFVDRHRERLPGVPCALEGGLKVDEMERMKSAGVR